MYSLYLSCVWPGHGHLPHEQSMLTSSSIPYTCSQSCHAHHQFHNSFEYPCMQIPCDHGKAVMSEQDLKCLNESRGLDIPTDINVYQDPAPDNLVEPSWFQRLRCCHRPSDTNQQGSNKRMREQFISFFQSFFASDYEHCRAGVRDNRISFNQRGSPSRVCGEFSHVNR